MTMTMFVETYKGNGRQTGHICDRHHVEVEREDSDFLTYYVGAICTHNSTDGYLAEAETKEELYEED